MILVDTFVAGRPKTKGSLTFIAPGYAKDSDDSRHWRAIVAGAVRDSVMRLHADRTCTAERGASGLPVGCSHPAFLPCGKRPEPYEGPVDLSLGVALPVAPLEARAGDLDKLLRNVLDALDARSRNPRFRGYAIIDDNQVCSLAAFKEGPAERTGVRIILTALDISTSTVLG